MTHIEAEKRLTVSAFTLRHYEGVVPDVSAPSAKMVADELAILENLAREYPDKAERIGHLIARWTVYRGDAGLMMN